MPSPFSPTFITDFATIYAPSTNLHFSHGYKPPLLDPTRQYALRQLRQTGSISDFQLQFETISHRVIAMSARDHLDCFISGLREDISRELRLLQPYCMSHAVEWAKEIEATFNAPKPSEITKIHSSCVTQPPPSKFHVSVTAPIVQGDESTPQLEDNLFADPNSEVAEDRKEFLPDAFKDLELPIPVPVRAERAPCGFEIHRVNLNTTQVPPFLAAFSTFRPTPQPPPKKSNSRLLTDRMGFSTAIELWVCDIPPQLTPTESPPPEPPDTGIAKWGISGRNSMVWVSNDVRYLGFSDGGVNQRNPKLGEGAVQHCIELESETATPYSLFSGIYATVGKWHDIKKLRMGVVAVKRMYKGNHWRIDQFLNLGKILIGWLHQHELCGSSKNCVNTKYIEHGIEIAFGSDALLFGFHLKQLMRLLGLCDVTDARPLFYKYMRNGSLHAHLHAKHNVENCCNIWNSWNMRIKYALVAAKGIEYIHNYVVPPSIYRDIKSSTMLLDSNWNTKIYDFGLSVYGLKTEQELMPTRKIAQSLNEVHQAKSAMLSWQLRMIILIGNASALVYLYALFVLFSKSQPDAFFDAKGRLSILLESGKKQVASFQCEPTGELHFELMSHSSYKLSIRRSTKTLGFVTFSIKEYLYPVSKLLVEKWLELMPCSGTMSSKPNLFRVAISFIVPVLAPYMLEMTQSPPFSKNTCYFNLLVMPQHAKSWTHVTEETGPRFISLQMRELKNTKNTVNPGKEVVGLMKSGETCTLALSMENGWSVMDDLWWFHLPNKSRYDGHLFELTCLKMVKFFSGRKLDYKPRHHGKKGNEMDFLTAVEFSLEVDGVAWNRIDILFSFYDEK